jgi:hypothetical protein
MLFSAPMVRALLSGLKTQTRRIEKVDVEEVDEPEWYGSRRLVHKPRCQRAFCETVDRDELACGGYDCAADGRTERSPYGGPGDRLWVKETSIIAPANFGPDDRKHQHVIDRDGNPRLIQYLATEPDREAAGWYGLKCRPSIFMPSWASRITLEIAAVRLERLQEISEGDAIAEGVEKIWPSGPGQVELWKNYAVGGKSLYTARESYRSLWEAINGPGSWAANPWVWAISFPRVPCDT